MSRLRELLDADPRYDYEVAVELHVSPARLAQYANGERPIPTTRVYDLCEYFKVNPDELLREC